MNDLRQLMVTTAILVAVTAYATNASADTTADQAAIRAVEAAWYKAYNAGDGKAVAALYADDAVLNAPGTPPVRGKAALHEYYAKTAAAFAAEGHTDLDGPKTDAGVSGDLAWLWGTYQEKDKSGAVVDAGKYITVFERKGGKWMIVRDTWNSDAAPVTQAATAAAPHK